MSAHDSRRSHRRPIHTIVPVIDTMTGTLIGRAGNISRQGMLLIANRHLPDDALYQVRFHLYNAHGDGIECEMGAHVLWSMGAEPGLTWTGMRLLAVPDAQAHAIQVWTDEDHAIPAATDDGSLNILPFTLPFGTSTD